MKKLLLIDGNALIHRAYHAYPSFLSYNGMPTNGVYGFAALMLKAISNFAPQYLAVCFDRPEPTFRKKLFANYQVHRPVPEDNLIIQFELVRKFLDAAHISRFELAGYEADDLIGTIAKHKGLSDIHIYILTGDKDILQLVDDHVSVIAPKKGLDEVTLYDPVRVKEKLGVSPDRIPDLKGLMGDASDNYPGVAGIGPKTANTLMDEFGTVENIYKHLDSIANEKTKKLLIANKDNAILSKELATIITNVDFPFTVKECEFTGYDEELKDFFEEIQFKSLALKYFPKVSINEQKKAEAIKISKEDPKKSSDQMGLF